MDLKAGMRWFQDLIMPVDSDPEKEYVRMEKPEQEELQESKNGFGNVITGIFHRKAGREEAQQVVNGEPYYDDVLEEDDEEEPVEEAPVRPNLVVHEAPKLKVQIYTPTSFDQAAGIADDLRDHRAVVVNYERVETELQRRICDFINGCCYVTDGGVKRISDMIVLYVPEGVNVSEAMSVAVTK